MKKSEIITALEPVIKAFEEFEISYYIGGSVASSAFGTPRTTLDVDLISALSPFHIEPLVNRLNKEYFIDAEMIMDALKTKTSFNIIHFQTMLKIDVFILKDQLYQQTAFKRKIKDKLGEETDSIKVFLCSPEDLILNKLEWYRAGGETSERQWLDVQGIIKVQQNSLDKEYLKKWAKEINVFDLLEKSFFECNIEL